MTHSKLTNQIRLSDQSDSREGTTVDTFLIHHQAGLNDDATIIAMVTGSKQVSANYTISNEGRITCVVDEDRRAWTSGSSEDGGKGRRWDMRAITVEIENESAEPDWRISEAALNAAAALLTDLRSRYRIANVFGHRDLYATFGASYPTYCPGPNTVANILARAGGSVPSSAAATSPAPVAASGGKEWTYWEPNGTGVAARVQAALKARGRYNGDVDDQFGDLTRKGVQETLNTSKRFIGPVDGVIEGGGCLGIQQYARDFGDYTGGCDAKLGINSWIGFALGLERP